MTYARRYTTQVANLAVCAGHSNKDPGAVAHGFTEEEIVREFRNAVCFCLDARGVVYDTDGVEGENQPLSEAVRLAKAHDVAVEFHCNAAASPGASGTEVYATGGNLRLADKLSKAIAQCLKITNRGAKLDSQSQHPRLAFCQAGGLVVELFFLTNRDDLNRFLDLRMAVADEVAKVLVNEVCDHAYW